MSRSSVVEAAGPLATPAGHRYGVSDGERRDHAGEAASSASAHDQQAGPQGLDREHGGHGPGEDAGPHREPEVGLVDGAHRGRRRVLGRAPR